MNQSYQLFTDGASRGNPGHASAGAILKKNNSEVVAEISEYLGEMTNNQAEYIALRLGLQKALELRIHPLEIFLDSELVVKQIKGLYKVKHPDLIPLFDEIKSLLTQLKNPPVTHVYREKNKEADKLANLAIDRYLGKK